jgi:UDP-N-acetylmuramoyl-tripeptide--D-alanyl-D-alanine ligase
VITNIGPSHLEFLKDLKGVFKEKTSLLNNLAEGGFVLLNADDPALGGLINDKIAACRIFTYGINQKSDFSASEIRLNKGRVEFKVNSKYNFELSSLGDYNVYNALPAIGIGRILGLSYAQIRQRLANFEFPKGRLKLVSAGGLNFIDDTYNSNPLSLKAAIQALGALSCSGRKIVVMGDMLELGRKKELLHRQIAWSITNNCDCLIAVGALAKFTAKQAAKLGWPSRQIFCCADAGAARKLLRHQLNAKASDLILVKGSRSMKMEEVLEI